MTSNKKFIKQINSKPDSSKYSINNSKDIKKIQSEIQTVLRRHNSPLPYITPNSDKNTPKKNNKSLQIQQNYRQKKHKSVHRDYLQKEIDKKQQYKNFLLTGFLSSLNSQQRTLSPKVISSEIASNQLTLSKFNFNFSRILQKRHDPLQLATGKLLFTYQSKVKLKRDQLVNSISQKTKKYQSEHLNLIKQQDSQLLTKYLQSLRSTQYQKYDSPKQMNTNKAEQNIFEVNKSLQGVKNKILMKNNSNEFLQMERTRSYFCNKNNDAQQNKEINDNLPFINRKSCALQNESSNKRKSLNVMDQQLLVYYSKIKHKNQVKNLICSKMPLTITRNSTFFTKRKSSLNLDIQKNSQNKVVQPQKITKQIKQWNFQNFDPWQKVRLQQQLDQLQMSAQFQS